MIISVGIIGRAHGIRGEVTVDVRTDLPEERFATGAVLRTDPGQRALTVQRSRWHKGRLLVQFDGVADRTAAEALRGMSLQVEIDDDETPTDPDEYFDHQLTGLRVVTADGADAGEVTGVLHGPNQDVLTVKRPDGTDALIPFVAQIVPEVDVAGGRVVVDPPPGLFELDKSREDGPRGAAS